MQLTSSESLALDSTRLKIILKNGSYKSGRVFLPVKKSTKRSNHSLLDERVTYPVHVEGECSRECRISLNADRASGLSAA